MSDSRKEPSRRRFGATLALLVMALLALPVGAQAASLQVVFPQTADVTVVQGQSAQFTLSVDAYGATPCDATTAPVRIDSLYSLDAVGDVAPALPIDMPIETTTTRGVSDNCYIKTPVIITLTATVAPETPVGDYTGVIRYGKGGDGGVDLDGPPLTIHVIPPDVALPPPPLQIVLGDREVPRHPTLGKTLLLNLVSGNVAYRAPGHQTTGLTTAPTVVPNGTKIDATGGVVKVTVVRDSSGATDSVDAWGGVFTANQTVPDGRGLTTFALSSTASSPKQGASAARVKKKNLLWVNGKGNFRTRGKRASAEVRGTFWLTEETGTGTKVSVKRGLVAVRDFTQQRTVLVSTGHSYTAPLHARHIRRRPVFTGSV